MKQQPCIKICQKNNHQKYKETHESTQLNMKHKHKRKKNKNIS
jgi:hypothetical protein